MRLEFELTFQNFHRVLLGTFHAKFLIVDRKVALINSNNIQGEPPFVARILHPANCPCQIGQI